MSVEINRIKHCPALLRCFWKMHRSNSINSYRQAGQGQLPSQEVQIYTWPDATLKELCELLQGAIPNADNDNAKLLFSLVFLDQNGNVGIRQIGQVSLSSNGANDLKTLAQCNYTPGDFLDVAVILNR